MTILTVDRLGQEHFSALLDRYASVVRVRDWISPKDSEQLSETMLNACGIRTQHLGMDVDGSKWATDHDRVGPSFTSLYRDWLAAGDDRHSVLRAYAEASVSTRELFAKAVQKSPIDRLFDHATSCWPNSAVAAELDSTPIFLAADAFGEVDLLSPTLMSILSTPNSISSKASYQPSLTYARQTPGENLSYGMWTKPSILRRLSRRKSPAPICPIR